MKRAMITTTEERLLQLERRSELWRGEGHIDDAQRSAIGTFANVPWVSRGLLASIALFVLTVLAVLAAAWFADEVLPFGERLVIAIASIVTAELLIRRFRWWSTGVEQALWLCGLFALILSLPGKGTPEAMLLFATAAFIAAVRLRSAPLGILGVLIIAGYVERRATWFDWRDYTDAASRFPVAPRIAALILAALSAVGGTVALRREWQRPSTEWFWSGFVALAPAAFLLASQFREMPYVTAALAAVLAAPLLAAGLVMRHHAPIVSAMILAVLAGSVLVREEMVPREVLLAIFGVLLLTAAYVASRLLRGRTRGIVITQSKLTVIDEAVETAASFGAAPHHAEAPPAQGPEGGGGFGGAGASGEY